MKSIQSTAAPEIHLQKTQRLEALGQFTDQIAHDFNNQLTVIQANADLIETQLPARPKELRGQIGALRGAVRRCGLLVRKLMASRSFQELAREPLNLAAVMTGMSVELRRGLPQHIEIRINTNEVVGSVLANAEAVQQIVMNLATNASDAMPDGGMLLIELLRSWLDEEHCRTFGWGRPGEYACLSMSDTGVGLHDSTLDRLSDPSGILHREDDDASDIGPVSGAAAAFALMERAGKAREQLMSGPNMAGSGLGMALVHSLVTQHDGFVRVYSEPGHGTTVRVFFPVVDVDGTPVAREASSEACGGSETILLAEDDDMIRGAAAKILERHGYTVLVAPNGEEAIDLFRAHESEIDLVLTDLVMPKVGGRELYERLRSEGKTVKFLFSSGFTAQDVREHAALAEDMPFLPKPWTRRALLARVWEVLSGGGAH